MSRAVAGAAASGVLVVAVPTAWEVAAAQPRLPSAERAAAPEKVCTDRESAKDDYGRKVNVSMCVTTSGKTLTVTFDAECFGTVGSRFSGCDPEGSWELLKAGKSVTGGRPKAPAPYPGPGSYQLRGAFTVTASKDPRESNAGFTIRGKMTRDITLTTAIAPGPRLVGSESDRTLTVKNVGDRPAKAVFIRLHTDELSDEPAPLSDHKGCSHDGGLTTECKLGDLAPGAKVSIELSDEAARSCGSSSEHGIQWRYGADNHPIVAATAC